MVGEGGNYRLMAEVLTASTDGFRRQLHRSRTTQRRLLIRHFSFARAFNKAKGQVLNGRIVVFVVPPLSWCLRLI
jgi:hypothetical protein